MAQSNSRPRLGRRRKRPPAPEVPRARNLWIYAAISLTPAIVGGPARLEITSLLLLAVGTTLALDSNAHGLRKGLYFSLAGLALWGWAALLPQWFAGQPAWRERLVSDLGIHLPGTATPQPWLTVEPLLLIAAGCLWLAHLSGLRLEPSDRRRLLALYAGTVAGLALLSLASAWTGWKIPTWQSANGFGPFPNRNQTGNLFAPAAIACAGLAFEAYLNRKHRHTGIWLAALCLLFWACVATTSRAAVLMSFGGLALWAGFVFGSDLVRPGRDGNRQTVVAVALSAALLAGTAFFVLGGKTVERLFPAQTEEASIRLAMNKDVLGMTLASPIVGIGAGNFESVFPFYRERSATEDRALHPDSDWLLLAAELGWPAVIFALAVLGFLLKGVWPFERGSGRYTRAAALAGLIVLFLHAFFDISAHRPATAFPAIFLASLCLNPSKKLRPLGIGGENTFRGLGTLLVVAGLIATLAVFGLGSLPGRTKVEQMEAEAARAMEAGDPDAAITACERGLAVAPLRWSLYFQRACAESRREVASAMLDFRRARYLEPWSSRVPFREAAVWGDRFPAAAFAAWRDALQRNRSNPMDYFLWILSATGKIEDAEVQSELRALASVKPAFWIAYLERLTPERFVEALAEWRAEDPALDLLDRNQRKRLFALWAGKQSYAAVAAAIEAEPRWTEEGWFWRAHSLAEKGKYENAYALAMDNLTHPEIPLGANEQDSMALEARLIRSPSDYSAAITLITLYHERRELPEATRVLERILATKNPPEYFIFLAAEIYAERKDWENAWKQLARYVELTKTM